jgi:hypothetical protein
MILVVTEKGTIEGFTAGWVAKRMLKDECQVIDMAPGDTLPDIVKRDVVVFGIHFARNLTQRMAKEALSLHIFDNDFKAKTELSGLKDVHINLTRSAARMAWEHLRADFKVKFGPNKQEFRHETAPWIVDYSDNMKLWKWAGIPPHFVKLAIDHCYDRTLESWDDMSTRDLMIVVEQGKKYAKEQVNQPEQPKGEDHGEGENPGTASRKNKRATNRASRG